MMGPASLTIAPSTGWLRLAGRKSAVLSLPGAWRNRVYSRGTIDLDQAPIGRVSLAIPVQPCYRTIARPHSGR